MGSAVADRSKKKKPWESRSRVPDGISHDELDAIEGTAERLQAVIDNPPWSAVRDYQAALLADPCAYCGVIPAVNFFGRSVTDHIIPRSVGGEDSWKNATGACNRCNSSKGAIPLLLWLARSDISYSKDRSFSMGRVIGG